MQENRQGMKKQVTKMQLKTEMDTAGWPWLPTESSWLGNAMSRQSPGRGVLHANCAVSTTTTTTDPKCVQSITEYRRHC